MFLTTSESPSDIVKNNEEWTLHRVDPKDLDNYKIFKDVKIILDEINKLKEWVVFTAKESFDGGGELVSFEME